MTSELENLKKINKQDKVDKGVWLNSVLYLLL